MFNRLAEGIKWGSLDSRQRRSGFLSLASFSRWVLGLMLMAVVGAMPRICRASADLDRQFAFENIACLRSWDNIDGLFAEYVANAYRTYFAHQSRFVQQNISRADEVLEHSKLPYQKIIEDPGVLGQLARVSRSQTIIRTKIMKEGPQYHFHLTWLHAPKMETIASDDFLLKEADRGKGFNQEEINQDIEVSLNRMFSKVPFLGMITGRDRKSITVNFASSLHLKPGDTLVIATLEEVKKHPLLKEIVDWQFMTTGKIQVEQVDESLAFCRVLEEEPSRQIARFQKVVRVLEAPIVPAATHEKAPESNSDESSWRPSLGWIGGSLNLGGFSRDFSKTPSVAKTGGGILLGSTVAGQLWLTREWFANLAFGYGFWSYSQQDVSTETITVNGVSGSATDMNFAGGYSYLINGDPFGSKAWMLLGYHQVKYTLPIMAAEKMAPASFQSIYVGAGAEMPLRSNWSGQIELRFGILPSGSETGGSSGAMQSASDVQFYVGASHRWSPRLTIRGGIQIIADSGTFTSSSLSEKMVTLTPSVLYYF